MLLQSSPDLQAVRCALYFNLCAWITDTCCFQAVHFRFTVTEVPEQLLMCA